MKTIIAAILVATFAQTALAKCTVRHYVDPLFEKSVEKSVNKALKKKGYTLLTFQAPEMEDYRLVMAFFPTPTEASFVRFYFQVFDYPNYKDMFRTNVPAANDQRNSMALSLLANIPACEKTL